MPRAHVLIPLAILEAMQDADVVPEDDGDPFRQAAGSIKFGGSATVAAQVARYRALLVRQDGVDAAEVAGLVRLVSRRNDALLVFGEAGRRAGRYAARRVPLLPRMAMALSPPSIRIRYGLRLVRNLAGRVFDVDIRDADHALWRDEAGIGAPDVCGVACELLGTATAELLRRFTAFDGALFHTGCRASGNPVCEWSANPQPED